MCKSLLIKIEKVRAEMLRLSDLHGMSSDIVLQTSRELDKLLYKYQRCQLDKEVEKLTKI